MARTRQQNVTAAQWTANGAALGAADLTAPGSYPFGENVFSLDVQRKRLPKDVFKRLQATLHRGEALDPSLAARRSTRRWPTRSPRRCASGPWSAAPRTSPTGSSR